MTTTDCRHCGARGHAADEVIAPLPDHEECVEGLGLRIGDRVELSPATDAWIRGDRFGEIVTLGRKYVHVKMDRSGRTRRVAPFLLDIVPGGCLARPVSA